MRGPGTLSLNAWLPGVFAGGSAEAARARRILILMCCTIALSVADLMLTITHMTSPFGMVELNPIARYLVDTWSVNSLVVFKLGTVGVAALLLHTARRTELAELAAWVCFAVLVVLCVHWLQYNAVVCDIIQQHPGAWSEIMMLSSAGELWTQAPTP